jgi:hypothetical protein
MEHRFMQYFAEHLAKDNWQVIRFVFPYMIQISETGKTRPPNPQAILLECWQQKISQYRSSGKLVLAGKSMGGRMASIIVDNVNADGLIVFGYPFHPPKKPLKLRTEHLQDLQTTSLFLQGERDTLGDREEVSHYSLSQKIKIEWLVDGDHSLKPRKKSGYSELDNWQHAIKCCDTFLDKILSGSH